MNGAGTLDLAGNNAYSGTTTVTSGTLELTGDEFRTGAIVDDSHLVLGPASVAALPSQLFPAGDQVTVVVSGRGTLSAFTIGGNGRFADFVAALNAQGAPLLASIGPISAGTDSIGFNRASHTRACRCPISSRSMTATEFSARTSNCR